MNIGAVLNGFMIGSSAPIVKAMASLKISIERLRDGSEWCGSTPFSKEEFQSGLALINRSN